MLGFFHEEAERLTLAAVTALAAKQSGEMAVFWPEAKLVLPALHRDGRGD
jgi:hypothetical protein